MSADIVIVLVLRYVSKGSCSIQGATRETKGCRGPGRYQMVGPIYPNCVPLLATSHISNHFLDKTRVAISKLELL